MSHIHVVLNPASGSRQAEETYKQAVLPYIKSHLPNAKVVEHRTECKADGIRIGRQILDQTQKAKENTLNVILLGGDGTTHEVLNGLVKRDDANSGKYWISQKVSLALVPTGTANALYASLFAKREGPSYEEDKLRSVRAMLSTDANSRETVDLVLSIVQTTDVQHEVLAHLITSHALHASILADSEAFRQEHPGIERFKMAFAQNKSNWLSASLELQSFVSGSLKGKIQQYDPKTQSFIQTDGLNVEQDIFLYFACLTTDRLEPAFVPAPFSGPICERADVQRPNDAVDVLLYRPLRNPALRRQNDAGQDFWLGSQSMSVREKIAASHLLQVSALMYQEGKHIDLTYDLDGDLDGELKVNGEGPVVCEYYRCAGYKWTPISKDAKRTCIDGAVIDSDKTFVRVLGKDEGAGQITVCR